LKGMEIKMKNIYQNVYQLVVINIFLILTAISGVTLQPQINFNATLDRGYYKFLYVGYDIRRSLVVFAIVATIYLIIELSIFLRMKVKNNEV